jgi:hypothetical protein
MQDWPAGMEYVRQEGMQYAELSFRDGVRWTDELWWSIHNWAIMLWSWSTQDRGVRAITEGLGWGYEVCRTWLQG